MLVRCLRSSLTLSWVLSPKNQYASYAFAKNRDLVKAASKHSDARWLVKMDVTTFFESISEQQVYFVFRRLGYPALLCFQLARICTRLPLPDFPRPLTETSDLPHRPWPRGHLPQGAPTSPMLANLAVQALDVHLSEICKERGWTYTRYADDSAFSRIDDVPRSSATHLVKLVEHAVSAFGLTVQQNPQRSARRPKAGSPSLHIEATRAGATAAKPCSWCTAPR
jgi:RNA-directed DNA polymerase